MFLFNTSLVKKFALTSFGSDCYDERKDPLTNRAECKEAAEELGQTFIEFDASWSKRTKGCISREHHVYWNKHEKGNKLHLPRFRAICKKKVSIFCVSASNVIKKLNNT